MRIVSQDKTVDVNYDNVDITLVIPHDSKTELPVEGSSCEIVSIQPGNIETLGKYKNKERALQIMTEIRDRYAGCCAPTNDMMGYATHWNVFEMPSE